MHLLSSAKKFNHKHTRLAIVNGQGLAHTFASTSRFKIIQNNFFI